MARGADPELLAFKKPVRDAKTLGRQTNLRLSIRTIHHGPRVLEETGYGLTNLRLGELMIASGYEVVGAEGNFAGTLPWFGTLSEVERQIADVEARRARAQAQLDEALLDDDERERRDAEAAALRDAFNSMRVRLADDGSLVAYDAENDVLDVTAMTELQRRAFEKMNALQCADRDRRRAEVSS